MKPTNFGGVVVLLLFKLIQLTINNIKLKPIMESKMKCKVVMLLSNDKATDFAYHGEKLINTRTSGDKLHYSQTNAKFQHLYLVSDEEIKVRDWIYNPKGTPNIQHHTNNVPQDNRNYGWRKIVATTDKLCIDRNYKFVDNTPAKGFEGFNVYLPLIPQSFIEKYVEVNGKIEEVMVNWETFEGEWLTELDHCPYVEPISRPILRKDNTVIISKVKDTWNYDEHCTDMQYYMEYCQLNRYVTPQKWLAEIKHY